MKKEKIIKFLILAIYFVVAIGLILSFVDTVIHPDSMGINVICTLPLFIVSIFIIIYIIKSIIDIINNKIKINIIDKVLLVCLIYFGIITLFIYYSIKTH